MQFTNTKYRTRKNSWWVVQLVAPSFSEEVEVSIRTIQVVAMKTQFQIMGSVEQEYLTALGVELIIRMTEDQAAPWRRHLTRIRSRILSKNIHLMVITPKNDTKAFHCLFEHTIIYYFCICFRLSKKGFWGFGGKVPEQSHCTLG